MSNDNRAKALCGSTYLASDEPRPSGSEKTGRLRSRLVGKAPRSGAEPRVLVIGYGNPLRGDDGLGWEAAERLMRDPRCAEVEVMTRHSLTPELAEPLSRAELAIFIDAAENLPPGKIATRKLAPASLSLRSVSHELDPATLLGSAKLFFGHAPTAWLFTIGGQFWGYREGLSPVVRAAVVGLVDQIVCLIAASLKDQPEREAADA